MVLDGVVSAALEHLRDVGPLVSVLAVGNEQDPLLFATPGILLDLWIQMVVPTFTTLLSNTAGKVLCDLSPLHRAMDLDELQHEAVFLLSPRALDKKRVEHFLPPVETLHICATR